MELFDIDRVLDTARTEMAEQEIMNRFGLVARQLDAAVAGIDGLSWSAFANGECIQINISEFEDEAKCYILGGILNLVRKDADVEYFKP